MKVRVKCTWFVDVELPDDTTAHDARFDIEENHCPGTGVVGAALEAAIAQGNAAGLCWACPGGTCEIISGPPKEGA